MQLAAIVESSDDAIVGKDLDGVDHVVESRRGAALRYSAAEAMGQSITLIIPPERLVGGGRRAAPQIRAGQRVEPFETVRRRKDGSDVEVSITGVADH